MPNENQFQKLVDLMAKVCEVDPSRIKMNTRFRRLGLDDLDLIELLMSIEEDFDITLSDSMSRTFELAQGMRTVRQLYNLVTVAPKDNLVPVAPKAPQRVMVTTGGITFAAEVVEDETHAEDSQLLPFDGVSRTIESIANDLTKVWQKVRPYEARVEFGLSLTAKSGKLTGLLVEGGGAASLTIALTWRPEDLNDGTYAADVRKPPPSS